MKIKIRDQERELLVQTVSLVKNHQDPINLYLFRCIYCGSAISQIQGDVAKITAGLEPRDDVVTINQCPECHKLYTFQTLYYFSHAYTIITLISNPGVTTRVLCFICRNPIVEFLQDKVLKFPDLEIKRLPFKMACPNPKCHTSFNVVDVI